MLQWEDKFERQKSNMDLYYTENFKVKYVVQGHLIEIIIETDNSDYLKKLHFCCAILSLKKLHACSGEEKRGGAAYITLRSGRNAWNSIVENGTVFLDFFHVKTRC